ncbi:MAG: hypothetical protein BBJ57_01860 [Desulfobacterales bacterium PC51MH44]|nr:MAG: hypothetical protein BBJ57_01860 [Desulfobacterales bacterium PC51MH44]
MTLLKGSFLLSSHYKGLHHVKKIICAIRIGEESIRPKNFWRIAHGRDWRTLGDIYCLVVTR